jgi:hypothetical protein
MCLERIRNGVVERQRAPFRLSRDQRGVVPEGGRDPLALFALPGSGEYPISSRSASAAPSSRAARAIALRCTATL